MPDRIPNPHTDTDKWVRFKRRKIGGHAAVTLAGASYSSTGEKKYQTPAELYDLLVYGIVDQKTAEEEEFLSWRLGLEPNIADRYALKTGRTLRRVGSCLHPENDMLMCSPDRNIIKDPRGVGKLEIKSRDPMVWNGIKLHGAPPADWVQLQFYLMVSGSAWGSICECNTSTGKLIHFDILPDREFHRLLMHRITTFLADCEAGRRPADIIPELVKMDSVGGELVTVDQMGERLVTEFKLMAAATLEAKSLRDRAKAYYAEVKEASGSWMESNGFDVVEGFGARIYNKMGKGKLSLKEKLFKADHPEIDLTKYKIRGNPHRTFKVYERPLAITQENGE